jgi:hypothetical protein
MPKKKTKTPEELKVREIKYRSITAYNLLCFDILCTLLKNDSARSLIDTAKQIAKEELKEKNSVHYIRLFGEG